MFSMLSRKKIGSPLHGRTLIILAATYLMLTMMAPLAAHAQTDLGTFMVTATRTPEPINEIGQSVQVISRTDIDSSGATDLYQVLEQVSGVDIRSRGISGTQADVSIRGGSFEQTLILLNGINMSNPQTGHHNMDLPIQLSDIERIEIIKGPGARIYGANAMSGVINIITRAPEAADMHLHLSAGSHAYTNASAGAALKSGTWNHRISAGQRYSSGFDADEPTGFNIKSVNINSQASLGSAELELGGGYIDKDFGASRFYFDAPDQKEQTKTLVAYTALDLYTGSLHWRPHLSYQRHDDVYDFASSGQWYTNSSTTDKFIAQLSADTESAYGHSSFGFNMEWEQMHSGSLGDHSRSQRSIFVNQRLPLGDKLTLGAGLSAVHYSDWGWEYWPGADINLKVTDSLSWFVSGGKSFRIPTYTEMYYNTPMNIGNAELKAEEAWTWETGLRYTKGNQDINMALFRRDSDNLIEWVRAAADQPWRVHNIASSTITGIETGWSIRHPLAQVALLQEISCSYTYLDANQDSKGLESKYSLNNLRHQLHATIVLNWYDGIQQHIGVRYEQRLHGDSSTVADTSLRWAISAAWTLDISVTNLFDTEYIEAGFSPAPGRWIQGGISWRI